MHDSDDQCWSCKTRNPALPAAAAATGTASPAGGSAFGPAIMSEPKKKCPFCAEEILAAAVKCKFCGSELPASRGGKGEGYVRLPKAVFAIALIFILAAIATWGWGLFTFLRTLKAGGEKATSASSAEPAADTAKKGAYEEVIEYDARGNVTKSTKNYD